MSSTEGSPQDAGTSRDPLIRDPRRRPRPWDFVRAWNLTVVPRSTKDVKETTR